MLFQVDMAKSNTNLFFTRIFCNHGDFKISAAHKYFVESISKAYQALTDPISRENFEKYGHPDGRQVI